jgi:hypothetical protein
MWMAAALVAAVVGAILGGTITWALGAEDRRLAKQALAAQQKIADLEGDRSRSERLARFRPQSKLVEIANTQYLHLEAATPFEVVSIGYLNANSVELASESVGLSGSIIDIPLVQSHLVQIMNQGPWTRDYDHSCHVILRVRLSKNGYPKDFEHQSHWDGSRMKLVV